MVGTNFKYDRPTLAANAETSSGSNEEQLVGFTFTTESMSEIACLQQLSRFRGGKAVLREQRRLDIYSGRWVPKPPVSESAQTWDVNSLSRCNSKFRSISSKDVPVGVSVGLNRQPHSEQPKPRKRCCSIHTSFRLMVGKSYRQPIWMVCRADYRHRYGVLFLRTADFGASFEVSEIVLTVGHVSCVAMLARRRGEANVRYPTEASRLAPVYSTE